MLNHLFSTANSLFVIAIFYTLICHCKRVYSLYAFRLEIPPSSTFGDIDTTDA
jgi:hypothetical protein